MPITSYGLRSTAISNVDYDSETETMTVAFVNGRSYTHEGVPFDLVERFISASSPGRFYNDYIKGAY